MKVKGRAVVGSAVHFQVNAVAPGFCTRSCVILSFSDFVVEEEPSEFLAAQACANQALKWLQVGTHNRNPSGYSWEDFALDDKEISSLFLKGICLSMMVALI